MDDATRINDGADPNAPAQPQEKTYRLGNQTFKYKTEEEMQQQLDQAMQQIGQNVQQQLTAAQQSAAAAPKPKAPKPDGFDKEQYAKLFLENPLDAANYLDEHRLGVKRPDLVLKTAIGDIGQIEQSLAVQTFMNTSQDYEATPQNFTALTSTMQEFNLPWTAQGMQLAFAQAKASGRIALPSADDDAADYAPVNRGSMPTAPRRGQVSAGTLDADLMSRYESMEPAQMKAFLERIQQQG